MSNFDDDAFRKHIRARFEELAHPDDVDRLVEEYFARPIVTRDNQPFLSTSGSRYAYETYLGKKSNLRCRYTTKKNRQCNRRAKYIKCGLAICGMHVANDDVVVKQFINAQPVWFPPIRKPRKMRGFNHHRWFTFTRCNGVPCGQIWHVNPIKHGPQSPWPGYEYCCEVKDFDLTLDDLVKMYQKGVRSKHPVKIPTRMRYGTAR